MVGSRRSSELRCERDLISKLRLARPETDALSVKSVDGTPVLNHRFPRQTNTSYSWNSRPRYRTFTGTNGSILSKSSASETGKG